MAEAVILQYFELQTLTKSLRDASSTAYYVEAMTSKAHRSGQAKFIVQKGTCPSLKAVHPGQPTRH